MTVPRACAESDERIRTRSQILWLYAQIRSRFYDFDRSDSVVAAIPGRPGESSVSKNTEVKSFGMLL